MQSWPCGVRDSAGLCAFIQDESALADATTATSCPSRRSCSSPELPVSVAAFKSCLSQSCTVVVLDGRLSSDLRVGFILVQRG